MGSKGAGRVNKQFFSILLAQDKNANTNLLNIGNREVVNFGAQSNTSKRSFTGKGIILGYAYSNWYNPNNVLSFEKNKNGFSFSTIENQCSYGVGFDLKSSPDTSYAVGFDGLMEKTKSTVFITEFDTVGNLLRFITGGKINEDLKARVFTTGENTAWIVISFQNLPEDGSNIVEYNNVSITLIS